MKPTSQLYDGGQARTRVGRRPRALDMSPMAAIGHEPLTPPCGPCGYPLLRSDNGCPRCTWEGRS